MAWTQATATTSAWLRQYLARNKRIASEAWRMTKDELIAQAAALGLDTEGTKADLAQSHRPASPPVTSSTGVELVEGMPYFGTVDGVRMNRRQWLAATADTRKKNLVDSLREHADSGEA